MMGACGFGKAAPRRRAEQVSGTEYLPSTFVLGPSAVNTPQPGNPLAVEAAARAMGRSYVKLARAASGKGRRLSADEVQDLMAQLLYGAKLQNRGL